MPEQSAVGYSQSNGRAERSVTEIEARLRTIKAALESRIQRTIPCTHPIARWLVEHTATIVTKYNLHDNGDNLATA